MAFAIVAEFPLGMYRGKVGEGELDTLPSASRVHMALTAAAGSGTRAQSDAHGTLQPSLEDHAALSWLEQNPPQGLALPQRRINRSDAIAFRDLGLLKAKMAGKKRLPKQDADGVALAGRLMWVWEEAPPSPVLEALDALCPDVAYLGQADSPVRMWVEATPGAGMTHRRQIDQRMSGRRSTDIDLAVPRPGRTDYLVQSHSALVSVKSPSAAKDRAGTDEKELRPPRLTDKLGSERFTQTGPVATGPWSSCWVLPFEMDDDDVISLREKTRFAVALHQAIIKKHRVDAPALLTGHYSESVAKPSNRISLQVIDKSPLLGFDLPTEQAFVVAVPSDADPADIAVISQALSRVDRVWVRGRTAWMKAVDSQDNWLTVPGDSFWRPPAAGLVRIWALLPAVVETRAQGPSWTLADAVALSVGQVWRNHIVGAESKRLRGAARYRDIVQRVRHLGVKVLSARALNESNVEDYLHRIPPHLMPLPYTAELTLGELDGTGCGFTAIGQSRHLGGGPLVPCDLSPAVFETWEMR